MQGQIKLWHDVYYYCDDDEIIEWYEDHKKCKAQKAKKRQVYAHCLASIKMVGLVYARRRERRDRKILEVDYLIC